MLDILGGLLTRASLEDPNNPITGDNLTADQLFGGTNTADSGIPVTDTKALELTPVWAGIHVIAGGVSKLPINAFRRIEPRGAEKDTSHPGHKLMQRPNQIMRPSQFKMLMMFQSLLYGNHISLILRDRTAAPVELLPVAPNRTRIYSQGGQYFYETRINDMAVTFPAIDVFHIKAMGFDGVIGLALTQYGRQAIGTGLALNQYSAKFFANSGRPSMILKHPGNLDEQSAERLRTSWQQLYGGSGNAGKTAVLEEGMEAQFLSLSPEESQAVDAAKFTVREVARLLNVQPHKLADLENASLRSVPEANQQFLDDTLEPWLTQIEEECQEKLLTEQEKESGSHYFDFDTSKLLRMNPKERAEKQAVQIASRTLNPNEAREEDGRNPYEGGDVYINPNVMSGGGELEDTKEEVEEEETETIDDERAQREAGHIRQLVSAEIYRHVRRIGIRARKEAKHDKTFPAWIEDTLIAEFRGTFVGSLSPIMALAADDRHGVGDAADIVDKLLVDTQARLDEVYSTANRGDFPAQVDATMSEIERDAAPAVAEEIFKTRS